jgi:hypothetical protein
MVVTGIVSATDGFAGTFRGGIAVFEDTSTEPIVRISQAGTGNAFVVEDSINPDVSPFVITGIGSVGIGTNAPSAKLDVHGTIRAGRHDAVADGGEIILARSSNNDDGWAIDVHTDRFRIVDIVQASSRLIISPGGNVGLGSDATSKLHVFGDAIVTGIATFGTSSVTIDGNTNNIRVGSAVTVNTTGINLSGIVTATTANATTVNATTVSATTVSANNVSVAGIVTANATGINVAGIVTATTLSKTTLSDYSEKVNALGNTGTAATINLANGNFVTATLTGNCTFTFTTSIGTGSQSFSLFLTNDATPSRTITWPASVRWPGGSVPVRTETANKTDVYSFFTFDNGTTWYGTLSIYNYS